MPKVTFETIDWVEVEKFFYRSMLTGWASGAKADESPIPGHQKMSFSDGRLKLLDMWSSSPDSDYSSGATTIYMDARGARSKKLAAEYVPIWSMQYGGQYPKEAIQFVMNRLLIEYRSPYGFHGCRGCEYWASSSKPFIYKNVWEHAGERQESPLHLTMRQARSPFLGFRGKETVLNREQRLIGYHEYFGGRLV